MFGCGKMTQIQLFTPLIENRLLFVIEAFLPYLGILNKKRLSETELFMLKSSSEVIFHIINQ